MAAMLVVNGFIIGGEQGWCTGESARLPPMCPGFDSRNPYATLIAVLIKSLKQCCVNVFRFVWEGTPVQTSRTAQPPKTQECTRKRPLGQTPSRPTETFVMFIKETPMWSWRKTPDLAQLLAEVCLRTCGKNVACQPNGWWKKKQKKV